MLTMMAAFAELERNLISERTASALAYKKSHLRVYGSDSIWFHAGGEFTENHRTRTIGDSTDALVARRWMELPRD